MHIACMFRMFTVVQDVHPEEVVIDDTNPPVPVIILSDADDTEIPELFPFPATYGSDIDAGLRVG